MGPERRVLLIVLGGTITMMAGAGGGIVPTLNGADLVRDLPCLTGIATVEVISPFMIPGASLTFEALHGVSRQISRAFQEGFAGVVVVQGTDTIDEVATGAMRGALRRYLDGAPDLQHVLQMAEELDISREAAARRYVSLHDDRAAVVFSRNARFLYAERSAAFPILCLRKGVTIPIPLKPSAISGPSDPEETQTDAWLGRSQGVELTVGHLEECPLWRGVKVIPFGDGL